MPKNIEKSEIVSISKFRFRLFISVFLIIVAILSLLLGIYFGDSLISLGVLAILVMLATWLLSNKLVVEQAKILKGVDRDKSDFISVASHQLRTPLTAIKWVTERVLKTQKLSIEAIEYLGDIQRSAQRLSDLVDILLNVSRIEGGRVGISPKALDLVDFIKDYFSEVMPLCAEKNINLSFENYPPNLNITTDPSALRNIIQSLVSNAIEYTPEEGRIEISLVPYEKKFLLSVKDSGIGIDKEERPRIFEKFFRADNAKRVKTDGTGLGLYIVKQAVELLGGKIWFESKENNGTTFFVELPMKSKPKAGERQFT